MHALLWFCGMAHGAWEAEGCWEQCGEWPCLLLFHKTTTNQAYSTATASLPASSLATQPPQTAPSRVAFLLLTSTQLNRPVNPRPVAQ